VRSLRNGVSSFFWSLTLFQAHPRPTAVLIDELDAGGLESLLNNNERCRAWVHFPGLKVTDGYDTDVGRSGELLLAPVKQPPGRSALRRGNHFRIYGSDLIKKIN